MSILESILLGITQALTEFLPVSSSTHLKLVKHFLGIETSEGGRLLDLSCHLGTLFALLIFLRKDLISLWQNRRKKTPFFVLALIPLAPSYFLLKPLREWASQETLLGSFLMTTGLLIFAGQFLAKKRPKKTPSLRHAFLIGTMQSMALIPGISRSASTISCARALGWEAKEAVRFSFLLSIPTILAGNLWEFMKAAPETNTFSSSLLVGFLVSFAVGSFCVKKAMHWLEKGRLLPCAWYCLFLGLLITLYFNR